MATESDSGGTGRSTLSIEAFERLVDAFGSDSSRWPADRRAAAEDLLRGMDARADRARRLVSQAQALERLLDAPRQQDQSRLSALAERISGAVAAESAARPVTPSPVTDLAAFRDKRVTTYSVPGLRTGWAASLLAASLLLGVFVGSGTDTLPAVEAAADAVGLGSYVDQVASSATDDPGQLQDEDVL